jgi:hypothetical protein
MVLYDCTIHTEVLVFIVCFRKSSAAGPTRRDSLQPPSDLLFGSPALPSCSSRNYAAQHQHNWNDDDFNEITSRLD